MSGSRPVGVELIEPRLLSIAWDDGKTLHYPLDHLRAACPCAHCQGHYEGEKPPLHPEQFPDVRLRTLEEVGSYALQISFTDDHGLGLYTWQHLRGLGFPEGEAPVPEAPPSFEV